MAELSDGNVGRLATEHDWMDHRGRTHPRERGSVTGSADNPRHPKHFQVRNDGWIGHSLCYQAGLTLEPRQSLRLRLGLGVRAGRADPEAINRIRHGWTDQQPLDECGDRV